MTSRTPSKVKGQWLEFLQKDRQLISRLTEEPLASFTEFQGLPEDED